MGTEAVVGAATVRHPQTPRRALERAAQKGGAGATPRRGGCTYPSHPQINPGNSMREAWVRKYPWGAYLNPSRAGDT